MKEKNKKNKSIKLAAVVIMFLFIGATVVQAVVKTTANPGTTFTWEDDFLDSSNIETTWSSNIDVVNGEVVMSDTYKAWRYPWPYMKKINIQNSGSAQSSYVMNLTVYKAAGMESDYSDLRFVYVDGNNVNDLEYWVGRTGTASADVWIRVEPGVPGDDDSVVYMFYGDKNAPSHSNFGMIFMWDDQTTPDIIISHKAEVEGAWDADVAFGGERFLVAWEERVGPEDIYHIIWGSEWERTKYCCIHGRTYNSDGGDDDPPWSSDTDIDISPGPPEYSYHAENPSAAFGGSKFLVAWEENPANPLKPLSRFKIDIKGALVTTSGSVTQLSQPICSADNRQNDPCVAYGAGKFLIVWEDARLGTGNYDVWGRFFTTSGSPSGSEFQITSGANYEGEPWVCSDGGTFVVVYEQGDSPADGPFNLYAKKLTSSGSTVWTQQIASGTSTVDNVWPAVSYNSDTNQYFICWNTGDLSSGHPRGSIKGNFMNQDGSLDFSNFAIQSGTSYIRADCVPYLGDMFFVSYDKGDEVWGKLVYNNDGTVIQTDEQPLSDGSSLLIDWNNLAVSDDGKIFPVWEDERDDNSPYADAYGSVWHIYKSTGSPLVSYSFGSKIDLVTDATLVSKVIDADDLDVQEWETFFATYDTGADDCNLEFYVLNKNGGVLKTGLGDISNLPVNDIRLKAVFSRSKAASSPTIDKWWVEYMGSDYDDPRTELYKAPPNGNNGWYKGAVDIELRGFDESSGVETIHYIIDDDPEVTSYDNPTEFTIRLTGIYQIEYWSVDRAGNIESHNYEYGIKIDSINPKVKITKPDTAKVDPGDITIEFTVSEEGSGFSKADLYINAKIVQTWPSEQQTYTYILEDAGPGIYYDIEAKAYDIAGNMGNAHMGIHTDPGGGALSYSPEIGYLYTVNGATGPHILLMMFSLSLVFTDKLTVKVKPEEDLDVTKVTFEIKGRVTQDGTDTTSSNGYFEYLFDPPTGMYTITAKMYSGDYLVKTFNWHDGKVFFINAF